MRRFLIPIIAFLSIAGCAVTPGGSGAVIDDAGITELSALGTTAGLLGIGSQQPAGEVPAAQLAYEVGSAINTGAKTGTIFSLAQLTVLVNSFKQNPSGPYDVLLGELLQLVITEATKNLSPAATQPSTTINPQLQEVLEDIGAGIMQGAMAIPGVGTPTSTTMGVEARGESGIVVKHFVWK